ncbi:MAG: cofactor-independent phosphoglycerate mutase [Planctomycetota bacterium]
MKYAIVIPDGAADEPLDDLGGQTPLQAAETPNMDWLSTNGKIGTVRNVPESMSPGSDVAILSVLGYDPEKFYTGRAPLEAAARGLEIADDEWVFRCNLVTIVNGTMEDHSAGHISTEEASAIVEELNRNLAGPHVHFYSGVSYRHLMTYRGDVGVQTTPPHDILGREADEYLPTGDGADMLRTLILRSREILQNSEINTVRRDMGENPATSIWLWGHGRMPRLPAFNKRYGVQGAAITAVDLIRGLSRLIGWETIEVPGATGFVDTNYAGKGEAAVTALDEKDLVFVHVEAPDEAGHNADIKGKVESISNIDRHIVGPVLKRLQSEGDDWRMLVMPDHPTPIAVRTHTTAAVPFAIAGKRVETVVGGPFCEATAAESDLHVPRGCEMMEFFLKVR